MQGSPPSRPLSGNGTFLSPQLCHPAWKCTNSEQRDGVCISLCISSPPPLLSPCFPKMWNVFFCYLEVGIQILEAISISTKRLLTVHSYNTEAGNQNWYRLGTAGVTDTLGKGFGCWCKINLTWHHSWEHICQYQDGSALGSWRRRSYTGSNPTQGLMMCSHVRSRANVLKGADFQRWLQFGQQTVNTRVGIGFSLLGISWASSLCVCKPSWLCMLRPILRFPWESKHKFTLQKSGWPKPSQPPLINGD